MCILKRKLLLNAFFKAQFSYCPLVWMCYGPLINNKINRLRERYFRIIYNDKTSPFAELLAKDESVTIHTINFKILANEIFKGTVMQIT